MNKTLWSLKQLNEFEECPPVYSYKLVSGILIAEETGLKLIETDLSNESIDKLQCDLC